MMKKRMLGVLALMLVCIFALSGCKKNVGTPEDNAVKEDSQDGEDAEEEEDTYSFGFSAIDMENPYFITLEITYGEFGLVAMEPSWITSRQIEAARIAMTRYTKRGGKVWIRCV